MSPTLTIFESFIKIFLILRCLLASNCDIVTYCKCLIIYRKSKMSVENVVIQTLSPDDVEAVSSLIKRNLEGFEEHGTVIASTFRRLLNLYETYTNDGCAYFIATDQNQNNCIGGIGIGPLHGLPVSEGVAEIRDLVVEKTFRSKGIGNMLLNKALEEIKSLEYKRVYLESTPDMENAHKLFIRKGFRPIEGQSKLPSYFIKDFK